MHAFIRKKKKHIIWSTCSSFYYNSNELQQRCLNSNQQCRQCSGGGKKHGEVWVLVLLSPGLPVYDFGCVTSPLWKLVSLFSKCDRLGGLSKNYSPSSILPFSPPPPPHKPSLVLASYDLILKVSWHLRNMLLPTVSKVLWLSYCDIIHIP